MPDDLKYFLAYTITCSSWSSCYSGKSCSHFKTKIEKIQIRTETACFDSYDPHFFKWLIIINLNSTQKLNNIYILIE